MEHMDGEVEGLAELEQEAYPPIPKGSKAARIDVQLAHSVDVGLNK
jgi:hypothetical protein